MTDIDIDASELDKAKNSLLALAKNLENDADEIQQEAPEKMRDYIKDSVVKNFENHNTKSDQTSLQNAFSIINSGVGSQITTKYADAPHAKLLEVGRKKSEYRIPKDGTGVKFVPKNINAYPEWMQTEDGYISAPYVTWKASKQETMSGYEYIFEAQNVWDMDMKRYLPIKIQFSIMQSGYKRKS